MTVTHFRLFQPKWSLLPLIGLTALSWAPLASARKPLEVEVDQAVDAGPADGSRLRPYARGSSIPLPEKQPLWISSKGFVPVLLVPVDTDPNQRISVKLISVEDWPPEKLQGILTQELARLSEAVFEIQKLLAAKNTDRALGLLDQLQGRFPALDYLNFMRASALVLKGDRKGATSALKKALATHPSNVEGQALLKALEGGGI
jgi:hypothetical protein